MNTRENRARRVAELDALPQGAEVSDVDGRAWVKHGSSWRSGQLSASAAGLVNTGEPLTISEGGAA